MSFRRRRRKKKLSREVKKYTAIGNIEYTTEPNKNNGAFPDSLMNTGNKTIVIIPPRGASAVPKNKNAIVTKNAIAKDIRTRDELATAVKIIDTATDAANGNDAANNLSCAFLASFVSRSRKLS